MLDIQSYNSHGNASPKRRKDLAANPTNKKSAAKELKAVPDFISGIALAAIDIQREYESHQIKEVLKTQAQLADKGLPLDNFLTQTLLPSALKLTSLKVEFQLELKTMEETGFKATVSLFGRPRSSLFELRFAREQLQRNKLTVEIEPVHAGPIKTHFEKEVNNG